MGRAVRQAGQGGLVSVVFDTDKAIEAAIAAERITDMDAGVVAVLRRLALAIDEIDEDGLNPGGKLDNVSIPTYLKYAEALGLTPAARKAVAPGGKAGPRGKLSLLREAEANRASA